MGLMFSGCSSLTSLNLSSFNTNKVTDMDSMFEDCSKLASLDLSNFNCNNIKSMENMFKNCKNLKLENISYKDDKIRNQLKTDLGL